MDKSFYNTINLNGDALKAANENAVFQERVIEAIFRDNPGFELSPSMVHDIFLTQLQKNIPITSIRRGITNLTKGKPRDGIEGILEKTEVMKMGLYQYNEHCWVLKESEREKQHVYKSGEMSAGDIASSMISNSKDSNK